MAHADLVGAVLDGRYQVIAPIAEGAMGVVYRAERLKLGKVVAVKVLHDELPDELASRQRFEIEAMAMAKLEHPHCAAVLDVGTHEGRPFVVMDFITGEDLKSLIMQGPVPIPRAVEMLRQVLSGLAHAHELGIVHRDIKPANVLLSQKAGLGDHITILDFGLARLQSQQTARLTTGIVVGTPAYMAPEQVRGGDIDPRADLYACGVLLTELLTAHKPFHSERDDPVEVVRMHLAKPPPRLADLLPGTDFGVLEDIVAKALAKAAGDRYQSATEFVAALDAFSVVASTPPAAPDQGRASSEADRMGLRSATSSPSLSIPHEPAVAAAPAPVVDAASSPIAASSPSPSPAAVAPAAAGDPPLVSVLAPTVPSQSVDVVEAARPRRSGPDGLPFSRRQLAIGGGAVLMLIIVIALVAGGGSSSEPVVVPDARVATSGEREIEMEPTRVGGVARVLTRADALIASGEREAALDLLVKSRAVFPDNARLPYLAGQLYFGKLWWTDGLKQFREAVRIDSSVRTDPELIKMVLKGFITTPSYNSELAEFLRNEIGAPARPYLEETVRDHPNTNIRARAKKELARYP